MKRFVILSILLLGSCGLTISVGQEVPATVSNISTAVQYIGFTERTHTKELKQYIGVDPRYTEWCAAFVNAVLEESGIPGSATVSDNPLLARSFLKWGDKVTKPEPGDIVVFPRGNDGWKGHVGFYIKSQTIDGVEYYHILGGNQNNRVSVALYRANRALAIRRQKG